MAKNIPLEKSIKVLTEKELIRILIDLGLINSKEKWTPKDEELFNKIIEQSHKFSDKIMSTFKEYQ